MPAQVSTTLCLAAAILCVTSSACRPPAPAPQEEATGTSSDGSTETPGTTFSPPDACESTEECAGENERCVAAYDPGSSPPMGPGACVEACIEATDLQLWCFDDTACCGELRCNRVDGFCEEPPSDSDLGSSSGSTGSGDSSGGSSSGTGGSGGSSSDGSSSGDSSGSSSDSSSGSGSSSGDSA